MERLAKIVVTLGPSCQWEPVLAQMIEKGIDVARLNFSHGSHDEHARQIALVRALSVKYHKPISILQDLQGPKIRTGIISQGGINLAPEQVIRLSIEDQPYQPQGNPDQPVVIPVDFPELTLCAKPGKRILLDDGRLEMDILEVDDKGVTAKVVVGGPLSSHKGINLPGACLPIVGFTEKDQADLAFGLEQRVDLVAISFVRTAEDIINVRNFIHERAPNRTDIPLVAKLERPEALENLEAIMAVTDGVMVARGDLGVEMDPATVPVAQKNIIEAANRHAKFVITATQMLDSMIHNPRPTRAEASDVANAVFDGTDALMLSGETSVGDYPVESVAMMDSIIQQAEEHYDRWGKCAGFQDLGSQDDAISITRAAHELALDRNVAAIAVFTQSGRTALLMSKMRPRVPILAFTPMENTFRRMGVFWGVTPYLVPFASTFEEMLTIVDDAIKTSTDIQLGQQIVLISGFPIRHMVAPNFALLHTVGAPL